VSIIRPLRVTRLDADGCPTGETVEVDAFDFTFVETPQDGTDDQLYLANGSPKEINFTMELCWRPGGKKEFFTAMGGADFWKMSEKVRRRDARRARKVRKRQR
jgi:hypothetical protein